MQLTNPEDTPTFGVADDDQKACSGKKEGGSVQGMASISPSYQIFPDCETMQLHLRVSTLQMPWHPGAPPATDLYRVQQVCQAIWLRPQQVPGGSIIVLQHLGTT